MQTDFNIGVRPKGPLVLKAGYRIGKVESKDREIPVLTAVLPDSLLFDAYLEFLDLMPPTVNAILSSLNDVDKHNDPKDYIGSRIETTIFKSYCYEFEDFIRADGSLTMVVYASKRALEIQLDEHKLLKAYSRDLSKFIKVLEGLGITRDDNLNMVSDGPHIHYAVPDHQDQFAKLLGSLNCRLD